MIILEEGFVVVTDGWKFNLKRVLEEQDPRRNGCNGENWPNDPWRN